MGTHNVTKRTNTHFFTSNIVAFSRYNGIAYTKCTLQDSPTGDPWCATQVFTKTREAVDYKGGVGVCQDWCDVYLAVADVVEPRKYK